MKFLKIFFILIFFLPGEIFGESNKNISSGSDDVKFSSENVEVDE